MLNGKLLSLFFNKPLFGPETPRNTNYTIYKIYVSFIEICISTEFHFHVFIFSCIVVFGAYVWLQGESTSKNSIQLFFLYTFSLVRFKNVLLFLFDCFFLFYLFIYENTKGRGNIEEKFIKLMLEMAVILKKKKSNINPMHLYSNS